MECDYVSVMGSPSPLVTGAADDQKIVSFN